MWLHVCRRATYYVIYLHTPHALSASKLCAQPCPDPSRLRVPHTCTRALHLRLQWLRAPAAELSVRAIIALLHALWYLVCSSANGAGRVHGAVPPGAGMPCHCRQRRALQKTPDDAGVVIILKDKDRHQCRRLRCAQKIYKPSPARHCVVYRTSHIVSSQRTLTNSTPSPAARNRICKRRLPVAQVWTVTPIRRRRGTFRRIDKT